MGKSGLPALTWVLVMVVFGLIDVGWIALVAGPLYQAELGEVVPLALDPPAAGLFYVVYTAGLTYFGLAPNRRELSPRSRVTNAALFGLFTYSTWGLTLKALVAKVPWQLVIGDIAWGTAVCFLTAVICVWVLNRFAGTQLGVRADSSPAT